MRHCCSSLVVGVGQDIDPAVGGLLGPPLGGEDALVARGVYGRLGNGSRPVLDQDEGPHDVDHRDFDVLALAGLGPVEERRSDRRGHGEP